MQIYKEPCKLKNKVSYYRVFVFSIFKQILATLNENSPVWPNEKYEKFEVFLQ